MSNYLETINKNILNNAKNNMINFASKNVVDYIINSFETKFTVCYTFHSYNAEYSNCIKLLKIISKDTKKHIKKVNKTEVLFGSYIINTSKKCKIIVNSSKNIKYSNGEDNGFPASTFSLFIIGKDKLLIKKKIDSFLNSYFRGNNNNNLLQGFELFVKNDDWYAYRISEEKRLFNTYFLNPNIKSSITNFINNWLKNKKLFESRNLKYKTGLLLHGKPGTGKTTLAKIIASEYNFTFININVSDFDKLNISEITECINNEYNSCLIFIDEIDVLFKSRDNEISEEATKRISKLLSFIDGSNSPNNCIFVATTNYFDRLDSALLRKGRFDLIIELGNLDYKTAIDMCKSFKISNTEAEKLLYDKFDNKNINPAELQDALIKYISEK